MSDASKMAGGGLRGELRLGEPMRRHTSWKAGGAAERFYVPADLADLAAFLRLLPADEPVHVIGLGSNLLVRDGGVRGTVVLTHGALKAMELRAGGGEALLYAEAGVPSPKVARFAALHDLTGAEFLAGVPGTVGGALAMNAGCYGGETWRIVARVATLDRAGVLRERTEADYEIGYRHVELRARSAGSGVRGAPAEAGGVAPHASRLTPHSEEFDEFFVAAWLRLAPGDGEESRRTIRDLLTRRIAAQPLQQPNAGSVFRNPAGDHAARLIESCGLKGWGVGGAMVSPKHANFIVNVGAATAADIEAVILHVQATVRERTGVDLVREVRILGDAAESPR